MLDQFDHKWSMIWILLETPENSSTECRARNQLKFLWNVNAN